jgi:DNA modification methylase
VTTYSNRQLSNVESTQDSPETSPQQGGYVTEVGEFWTSGQRQGNNLHEVSYRACFKPQLPEFFIERFSEPDDLVYDPFAGRGTTAIQSALMGRRIASNDVNPLSTIYSRARLCIPTEGQIEQRLGQVPRKSDAVSDVELSMFFEENTLAELLALRSYFADRKLSGEFDHLDEWIQMVALSRLTGHSPGFFSVYTLPPNQAVSAQRQIKLNKDRNQSPTYRDTHQLILKKSRQLSKGLSAKDLANLSTASQTAIFSNNSAAETSHIETNSVGLTVTSPPFLDVVQYADDNWLRAWFAQINMIEVASKITMSKTIEDWSASMSRVFAELYRVTKPEGFVAFEVGEVKNGSVRLEDAVLPVAINNGFRIQSVLVNSQEFTKTSNIWGVRNNAKGTNTNRIVLMQK